MSQFKFLRGLAFSMAVLMCAPAIFAGKSSGSKSSSSSSHSSSSRSSSGGGSFSSKPKPAPVAPKVVPAAKSTPSAGLTSRNNATASTIGSKTITAKPVSTPAAKLSSADKKMVETMKKNGVKTASRDEAKTALLKKDPSLASPQAVSGKFNSFTSKPTSVPSYMPENTAYNGTSYTRVLYQDPLSGSYSYRYRDPLGSMIDAYMIASIADNMTDYAMARQGIYYSGSRYDPSVVVVHRGSSGVFILVILISVIALVVVALVAFNNKRG